MSSLCFKVYKFKNELKSRFAKSNQVVIRADIFDENLIEMNFESIKPTQLRITIVRETCLIKTFKFKKKSNRFVCSNSFVNLAHLELIVFSFNELKWLPATLLLVWLIWKTWIRNRIKSIASRMIRSSHFPICFFWI